jgi:hypothetical protein
MPEKEKIPEINTASIDKSKNVWEYRPALEELDISLKNLEKNLGYSHEIIPKFYAEKIQETLHEAVNLVDIRVGYRLLNSENLECYSGRIQYGDTQFITGNIIAAQLKESRALVAFAGTAGKIFSSWSKSLFDKGDFPGGFVVDIVGSEIIEAAIDWLEQQIENELSSTAYKMTNRFSPGYCGWNVREQFKLFSFFPEEFCGIELTDSALMIPVKSVSGIIGLGEYVEKKPYPCNVGSMQNCYRRGKFAINKGYK